MSLSYLSDLKLHCPPGHWLAVMFEGQMWLVRDVKTHLAELEKLQANLTISDEPARIVSNIKVSNYWYIPKKVEKFGINKEDE